MWNYGSAPHWAPDGRSYYSDDGQSTRNSSNGSSGKSGSNFSPPKSDRTHMPTRFIARNPSARFGTLGTLGNASAEPASGMDPNRQAVDSRSKHPSEILFSQASRSYKKLENAAFVAKSLYKARLETAQKVTLKMMMNSPGVFCGQIGETKAWHQTTAAVARCAADAFHA